MGRNHLYLQQGISTEYPKHVLWRNKKNINTVNVLKVGRIYSILFSSPEPKAQDELL